VVSRDGRNTSAILEVMLSSSRRVKKGPGRRPQSAKRRRFMELRERGLSIDAAAHEVGVTHRWKELGERLQDVPLWSGGRVRAGVGPP
jgi:hypothetical protein